jgi:hypothetical protein
MMAVPSWSGRVARLPIQGTCNVGDRRLASNSLVLFLQNSGIENLMQLRSNHAEGFAFMANARLDTEEAGKILKINCKVKRQICVHSRQLPGESNDSLIGTILIELRVCSVQG